MGSHLQLEPSSPLPQSSRKHNTEQHTTSIIYNVRVREDGVSYPIVALEQRWMGKVLPSLDVVVSTFRVRSSRLTEVVSCSLLGARRKAGHTPCLVLKKPNMEGSMHTSCS